MDRDEGDDRPQVSRHKHEGIAAVEADEPLPAYQAPHHLTVRSTLRVPSQELYRSDIRKQLNYVVTGTDFFDESTVAELELEPPVSKWVLNRYIYRVNYRLSKETMARIQKQLKLFPDV